MVTLEGRVMTGRNVEGATRVLGMFWGFFLNLYADYIGMFTHQAVRL